MVQLTDKALHTSLKQWILHLECHTLHLGKCIQCLFFAIYIVAYNLSQEISGKASLPRIYDCETLLKLHLHRISYIKVLHHYILLKPCLCCNILNPITQTTYLILPAAPGAHKLFHYQYCVIQLVLRILPSDKLPQSLDCRTGKYAAGSKSWALRYADYFGRYI